MTAITSTDPLLTDALDAIGFSKLTKYRSVRIWRQTNSRLGFLNRILEQMEPQAHRLLLSYASSRIADSGYSSSLDEVRHRFTVAYCALLNQINYVEDCVAQLDINNTIDQEPTGDLGYSLTPSPDDALFTHSVDVLTPLYRHWDKYWADYSLATLKLHYSEWCLFPSGTWDTAAKLLVSSTYASRRSTIMSRINYALKAAHDAGWYMVFDTLTIAPARVMDFYDNPNALRDYFRNVGRRIASAIGADPLKSHADFYQYFCVPEYGTERGRLHFHVIHLCRDLPAGSIDPNFGRRVRNARQIDTFKSLWSYGQTLPIALRYCNDAFTRRGWLWPVDANGKPVEAKPYIAIGYYVSKYVCKNVDMAKADNINSREDSKWNRLIPLQMRKSFRVRMSRQFGIMKLSTMGLSTASLLQLNRLHHSVTPFNRNLRVMMRKEICRRLSGVSITDIRAFKSPTLNLLAALRASMKATPEFSLVNFTAILTPTLNIEDISDESRQWLSRFGLLTAQIKAGQGSTGKVFGSK